MTTAGETIEIVPDVRDIGLTALLFARRVTMGLLEDIPEDQWLYQPVPGGNHATWVIGHIAFNDDNFLVGLGGGDAQVPALWKDVFGAGSTVTNDATAYPSRSELLSQFESRRNDLLSFFKNLPPDRLTADVPEPWQVFGKTPAHVMNSLAWHEGLHAGQLTVIRRALGLGPKFG